MIGPSGVSRHDSADAHSGCDTRRALCAAMSVLERVARPSRASMCHRIGRSVRRATPTNRPATAVSRSGRPDWMTPVGGEGWDAPLSCGCVVERRWIRLLGMGKSTTSKPVEVCRLGEAGAGWLRRGCWRSGMRRRPGGGFAQCSQASVIFVLVDLASGEPLGQQLLGRSRRWRGGEVVRFGGLLRAR